MIPVPSGVRVWLAVGRTDMRKGMNGLALQVQQVLGRDPHAGDLYVFRGARGDLTKTDLFLRMIEGGESCRANLPPFVMIDFDQPRSFEKELRDLPTPLFIKLDGALARGKAGDEVIRVADATEARRKLEAIAGQYRKAMVQGYVPGRGAGAFLLRWDGRTVARMMHLRLHEMPHTGGASSLRRSWWHEAMMSDAELKVAHLG